MVIEDTSKYAYMWYGVVVWWLVKVDVSDYVEI